VRELPRLEDRRRLHALLAEGDEVGFGVGGHGEEVPLRYRCQNAST
jgi:hypothetical protein